MYKVKKILKDIDYNPIFEFILLNKYDVEIAIFHEEKVALQIRDLLNNNKEQFDCELRLKELLDANLNLQKENEELKKINGLLDDSRMEALSDLGAVIDENEQLKSELGKLNILYKAKCKTEEQLIEMGNEVEKENEQLKEENERLCNFNLHKILDKKNKENERLKSRNKKLLEENHLLKEYVEKENEELKQEIQSIYEIVEEYVNTHHAHSSMRMKKQIEKVMWNDKKGSMSEL